MKKTILTLAAISIGVASSQAATVRLDSTGTGADLDGISPTTVVNVVEEAGLSITLHGITGIGTGLALNVTATSLGINSVGSDDTDAFDADFNESATFSFNQAVSITQLDLTAFESGDVFEFGSTMITNTDLSNGTTDLYDFASPLLLAANEQFTISSTTGTVGIEALTLTVVPEPSSTALLGLGGLAFILRRRK